MYKQCPAVQQTFHHTEVWGPLYRMRARADDCEAALFRSAPVRRLKHLHHFGAGALFCPVTHSRYEHTVGVWALVRHFFPEHRELRAAAIVHDGARHRNDCCRRSSEAYTLNRAIDC
ncbi:hypothetical protein N0M98_28000 [Paenibacillus doosanensis]|uniref:hypothetical protein n=1 Tax=Paenibacillus doosanensis TaxID=1229154 RepID=UPI002180390A|nr:hypothetical protein [Paenibacillus doosanensis]MCS7463957.1 hypothetical protein [Paenibacillus doosanensis]